MKSLIVVFLVGLSLTACSSCKEAVFDKTHVKCLAKE